MGQVDEKLLRHAHSPALTSRCCGMVVTRTAVGTDAARYDEIAAQTDELVRTWNLDAAHELPPAPWFQPGARWSARRVLTHIIAETAQHAGHADILRESIDGQKSMG